MNVSQKVLVFTATYNELDNIQELLKGIWQHLPNADVLVIDDNSPDGTGKVLEDLKASQPKLSVIHRYRKLGVGSAHKVALKYAQKYGYDAIITMDADFSHDPKYLPTLLAGLEQYDFVIGSRFAEGGKLDYTGFRRFISFGANFLARRALGIKIRETTTSFRAFNKNLINALPIDRIKAEGYSFFIECTFRVCRSTNKLLEIPIHFQDRRFGQTKISKTEVYRGFLTLGRLFFERLFVRHKDSNRQEAKNLTLVPCPVCSYSFHTQVFAATSNAHSPDLYCSTSSSHSAHGRIVQCLTCNLVYTNPQLPEGEILSLYSNTIDHDYIKNIGARYETFKYNLKAVRHLLPRSGKLLEVGSYCGAFLKTARDEGFNVYGLEPSKWASDFSKKEFGVEVFNGNLKQFMGPGNFDVAVSWDVLEHVSDPLEFMKSVNRQLKMGGVFSFSTLDYKNWYPQLLGEKWPWMMDMHIYYFDVDILRRMAYLSGFKVEEVRSYCHIITFEYFLAKLHSLGVPGAQVLGKFLGKTFLGKFLIPFRFGDIKLLTVTKVKDLSASPALREAEL